MKNIGIYTNQSNCKHIEDFIELIKILHSYQKVVYIHQSFNEVTKNFNVKYYYNLVNINKQIDILITIGGDGTFLESIYQLNNSEVPIVGINTGRLGFLANVNIKDTEKALKKIFQNNFTIETRSMVELSGENIFESFNKALNEFTIHKLDTSSMISIEVNINNILVNTYWADGLIISTPTGSTAYSLSAGGPIIHPSANCFVITPIAAHNLNIRPLIVPDNVIITLKVSGRSEHCMISLDSRSKSAPINSSFTIKKSTHQVKMVQIPQFNFFNTLKNKLLWGVDKRN